MVFREGACPSLQIKQASIEHKLAESWCGSVAEWGEEGNSGKMPGAKHTAGGTTVGAFVTLGWSEFSTGDSRADEARLDSSVAEGGAMAPDAGRRLIGPGVKLERDGSECRGSAAAPGLKMVVLGWAHGRWVVSIGLGLQLRVTVLVGNGKVRVMSFPIMQQSSLRGLGGWNVRVLVSVSFCVCFFC